MYVWSQLCMRKMNLSFIDSKTISAMKTEVVVIQCISSYSASDPMTTYNPNQTSTLTYVGLV
jgi:hypothetical protein